MSISILRQGDSGTIVRVLQQALLDEGFSPGEIDSFYGKATAAAVVAYQRSERLLPDGIAGPRTLSALGLCDSRALPSAIPGVTVEIVSQMFPFTPVSSITANLPAILSALLRYNVSDKSMVLAALSTVRAEVECFEPLSEGRSSFNTSPTGHPFDLYDCRKDLGNTGAPDGRKFRGRGYVQLTGRSNYSRYGPRLVPAVDLIQSPDTACVPDVAANLLALFLVDRESEIKNALLGGNTAAARQIVNGGSNGLDRFVDAFQRGSELLPDTL
jgi:putative chitinase